MMSPQEMGKLEVFLFHAVAKDTGMGLRVARVKSLLDAQTDKYKALTNVDITNRLLSMSGRGMVSRDKRNGQVYWGSDPEMSAARMSEMAQSREGTGPGSGAAKPKPKAAETSTPTPLSAPTPVVASVPLSEDRPSEDARTEQDQQALGAQQREA